MRLYTVYEYGIGMQQLQGAHQLSECMAIIRQVLYSSAYYYQTHRYGTH